MFVLKGVGPDSMGFAQYPSVRTEVYGTNRWMPLALVS